MYSYTATGHHNVGAGKVIVFAQWRYRAFVYHVA